MGTRKSTRVIVERELIKSKAFLSLRIRYAPQALLLFMGKRQIAMQGKKGRERPVIVNQGKIEFTFLEAEKQYGWPRKRFAASLRELLEKGFIDVAHHGGGYQRDRTLFVISDRWKDYGTPAFVMKEWPNDKVQRGYRKSRGSIFSTAQNDTHIHGQKAHPKPPIQ